MVIISDTYNKFGLEIRIQTNKKSVQFLDVEFNLENETYKPFLKPGDNPLYVHIHSNHPPSIIKNIPEAINKRLSSLSSNEEMFNSVAPIYQEALRKSGYTYKLHFNPQVTHNPSKKRNRRKDILWFNPPFSTNIKTKFGAKFLKLIDTHFPKDHPLRPIINRNTIKISYRNTPNIKKIISSHNTKLLKSENSEPPCNCQKNPCPLPGQCRAKNVIYQATVTTQQNPPQTETYVGMTSRELKKKSPGTHNINDKN